MAATSRVIADYFDFPGAFHSPTKTDSPLIVYSNAELTRPIATEHLQSLGGRNFQIQRIVSS
jgi:hypothetical protein